MNIEVRKTQFVNKGAELMLHAILQNLHENFEEKKIVMVPRSRLNPYEKFSKLGLYPKASLKYKGIQLGELANLIPKKVRDLYGIVLDKELDVVLDAGGFEYTDFWPEKITEELAKSSSNWRKRGTKLILLPQAFGPFTSLRIKRAIKKVIDNADLVFARDIISYNHLIDITGKSENIRMAPDFTNLIRGIVPENFNNAESNFCIIPNYRMVDKTSVNISENYISFMRKCLVYLLENGHKPFVLIHEGKDDRLLAENIIDGFGNDIKIIIEDNPLHIKGIIGASEGVISSRYHGLVSGLSQRIPSFGTSWSHKYKMLFGDYDFEDGLLNIDKPFNDSVKKLKKISSETDLKKLRSQLEKNSEKLKLETEIMWQEVYKVINE